MYFIGYDVGSSSLKAALLDGKTGKTVASAQYPDQEMPMTAKQAGWAEQHPEMWWNACKQATARLLQKAQIDTKKIIGIGISYQMHGLVVLDKNGEVLRPSIIWCDSRAVSIGNQAFKDLGSEKCLSHLLNSPGNFTASKLCWVKENEPEVFAKIDKFMLPGDYLNYKLSGSKNTTISGLSEGMFWDFKKGQVADFLMNHYGLHKDLIPEVVPTFSEQGSLSASAAKEMGLPKGIKICYRAGDQPNNALSLKVLNAGEVAATAGTSGVVYGVSDQVKYDPASRVNTFAHVNHTTELNRLGILLCINGTGISNAWLKRTLGEYSYPQMNELAAKVPVGSDGLVMLPFGNGAERVLGNVDLGAQLLHLNFNIHREGHLCRAVQEGIVFSFQYGLEIMEKMGLKPKVMRAGHANLFLSPLFRQSLANTSGIPIELYNTDGATGAAIGAAIGYGATDFNHAFDGLAVIETTEPARGNDAYCEAYGRWLEALQACL
ncbi:MAG: FGGY family carbohydrate kinase [Bacteroidota bacterium]